MKYDNSAEIMPYNHSTHQEWLAFLKSSERWSPFLSLEWIETLHRVYGGYPCFSVVRRNEMIVSGIPLMILYDKIGGRRIVSLPYSDSCEPVYETITDLEQIKRSMSFLAKEKKAAYWELRAASANKNSADMIHVGNRHIINLKDGIDQVYKNFKHTRIRDPISKAQKQGKVKIEIRTDAAAIQQFYQLHLQTRKRLGALPQGRSYFSQLHESMVKNGRAIVVLALNEHQLISGAVLFLGKGTVVLKHLASLPHYWNLYPNHLVIWQCIRIACERGDDVFDFGRTGIASSGLNDFKRGWGAIPVPLFYCRGGERIWWRRIAIQRMRQLFRMSLPILPVNASGALGKIFYKGIAF